MAKRNIKLACLYSHLKASLSLFVASFGAGWAAANDLTECRLTIAAAQILYLPSTNVRRLDTELKVFTENTFDTVEPFLRQDFA